MRRLIATLLCAAVAAGAGGCVKVWKDEHGDTQFRLGGIDVERHTDGNSTPDANSPATAPAASPKPSSRTGGPMGPSRLVAEHGDLAVAREEELPAARR